MSKTLLGSAAVAITMWCAVLAGRAEPRRDGARDAAATTAAPTPPAAAIANAPPPQGHLLLVVSGDRKQLSVDHVVAKPDPWQGTRLDSPYRIRVVAIDGHVLGSYPVDLSAFDLRPDSAGRGIAVQGCKVVDTMVHALVSIPHHPDAARLEFVHANDKSITPMGSIGAARWTELTGESR